MNIVSSGKVLNSLEFYKKKIRKRRVKLGFLLLVFLLIIYSLTHLSREERFLISAVAIIGEDVINREEITGVVRNELQGSYLWLVPKTSIFLYPKRKIEKNLLEQFPGIKSAHFNVGKNNNLHISIDERQPFAIYCERIDSPADPTLSLPERTGVHADECYFIDEEGLIFAVAPSFSGGVYFVYTAYKPIEEPLGKRFVSKRELDSLSGFIESLSKLNILATTLEVGDDEYYLFIIGGGQIIWRKGSDMALIYANLEAFLSDETIQTQSDFLGRILYLDLRTENKVFYKFRE